MYTYMYVLTTWGPKKALEGDLPAPSHSPMISESLVAFLCLLGILIMPSWDFDNEALPLTNDETQTTFCDGPTEFETMWDAAPMDPVDDGFFLDPEFASLSH